MATTTKTRTISKTSAKADADPSVKKTAIEQLESAVAAIHDSDSFRRWLDISARFHTYSWGNQLLIAMQRPDATYVAGYQAWLKLGRQVKKGEKSINILVPHVYRTKGEAEDGSEDTRALSGFGVGHVFDIAQTDGKELPTLDVPTLAGDAGAALWNQLTQVAKNDGVSVTIHTDERFAGETMGYYQPSTKAIVVRQSFQRQMTKTLAHELGHHLARIGTRAEDECIAEGVAYVVLAYFGIDSGERSFPYVAGWAKDTKVLRGVMQTIAHASDDLIERVKKLKSE